MSKGYRLLIFDWDGTLMDSEPHIVDCFQAAMADMGLEVLSRKTVSNIIGLGMEEAVDTLFPGRGVDFRTDFILAYRNHFFAPDSSPPLYPGAAETVREVHEQGYLLAVATGKGRRGLDKVLAETGLGRYFHATRCAGETRSKPDPCMLYEILEELGVAVEDSLMIGDTEYDLKMAANAGMDSLACTYGVHETARLLSYGPVGTLEDIRGLSDWLRHRSLNR
jgi:phosphoglycolate phosphatase